MFEAWLETVDRLMLNLIGMNTADVEDWNWFDRFADGVTPNEALADWRGDVLAEYGVGSGAI